MKKFGSVLAAVLMLVFGTVTVLAGQDAGWSIFRIINPDAFEEEPPTAEAQAFLDSLDEAALLADAPVQIVSDRWTSSYELGLELEAARKEALGSYAMFYTLGADITDAFVHAVSKPMSAAGEIWFMPFSDNTIQMSYTASFSEDQSEAALASSYNLIASFMSEGSSSFEKPEENHYIGVMEDQWYDDDWNSYPSVLTQDCTFDPDAQVMTYLQTEYVTDLDLEIREFYSVAALGGDTYEITTDTEYLRAVYRDGVLGDFRYFQRNEDSDVYRYEITRTGDDVTVIVDGKPADA